MRIRYGLRRVHIWLGWLVGIPILLWTASGLFMAAVPIERVRGEHLLRPAPPLALGAPPTAPAIGPRPVASMMLEQRHDGPRWLIRYADGDSRLADATTGRLLPPLTAAEAVKAVEARYAGSARIVAVDRTPADAPPLELRRPVETWRVSFDDGTRFYVSASAGELLARRTGLWRTYDFLWGLHIMDPAGRDDFNNGWLIGFSALGLLTALMALALLPMTIKRKGRKGNG